MAIGDPIIDEHTLLQRMRAGDSEAFEAIYLRYSGVLYSHAAKQLKSQDGAKDIVHDIFMNLWNNRADLHISGALASYLFQSVRNRVINLKLKDHRYQEYVSSFSTFLVNFQSGTDYLVREKILTELIETEIASLPTKMKQVFELSRKEGLSHKEIALYLQITEQSVRSHIKGALRILRLRLGVVILSILLTGI